MTSVRDSAEMVVLLDDDGQPCGVAPKNSVHDGNTPLHLAFSCWVFDDRGQTLLTQRAATKRTWPGVWTNTFCGHPAPGEKIEDAVQRRARDELGTRVSGLSEALPHFRYRAVMADGTVENEICPVYFARLVMPVEPHPDEVGAVRWVAFSDLQSLLRTDPSSYSPWMWEQLQALSTAGWEPPPLIR